MSTKFVSPVGLLVAQGPDMAGIKKACELDAWKQPDAGLEFSLQKACYTDDTGTITMVDSTKQPVTGKLTFVIMSAIPLSPLRSVYLLKGRLKGAATLNGPTPASIPGPLWHSCRCPRNRPVACLWLWPEYLS